MVRQLKGGISTQPIMWAATSRLIRRIKMKVTPLQDRILIKRIESAGMTKSGLLHIPDSAKEKPAEAVVVAVGAGKMLENGDLAALQLKAGDQVLFGKYSGTEIKVDGVDHLIIREDDVLGIVSEG
jgi:chaperonin GroES